MVLGLELLESRLSRICYCQVLLIFYLHLSLLLDDSYVFYLSLFIIGFWSLTYPLNLISHIFSLIDAR